MLHGPSARASAAARSTFPAPLRPLARTRPPAPEERRDPGPLDLLAALVWTDEGPLVALSQNGAATLTVLLLRADNDSGVARPIAYADLGGDARASRTGAWRALLELELHRLVEPIATTTAKGQGPNAYRLNLPRLRELYAGTHRAERQRAASAPSSTAPSSSPPPEAAPAVAPSPERSKLEPSPVPTRCPFSALSLPFCESEPEPSTPPALPGEEGDHTPDHASRSTSEEKAKPRAEGQEGGAARRAPSSEPEALPPPVAGHPGVPDAGGASGAEVRLLLTAPALAILDTLAADPELAPLASPRYAARLARDEVVAAGRPLDLALQGLRELGQKAGDARALHKPWTTDAIQGLVRGYIRGARAPRHQARERAPVTYAAPDRSASPPPPDRAAHAALARAVSEACGQPPGAHPPRRCFT